MESRTGLAKGVEKPPVAPKPKVIPPVKPNLQPCIVKHELKQENTVKPVPKPRLLKSTAPPMQSKPVSSESEHQVHFQQTPEMPCRVSSTNGLQHKTEIDKVQALATTPVIDAVCDFSINQSKQTHVIQSHRTAKHKKNTARANGLPDSKRHATKKHLQSSGVDPVSPATPKTSVSKPVTLKNQQQCHSDSKQNGYSFSDLVPVRKPPPIPVQDKSKSSIAGQQKILDVNSQELSSSSKPSLKVGTVKEHTLHHFQKEGLPSVATVKRVVSEKKQRRRGDDNVELSASSSRWRVFSPEPKQIQEVTSNSTSNNTPGKRTSTNIKPKVKSFSAGDKLYDTQKKSTLKKMKHFDLTVKNLPKLFSKAGHSPDVSAFNSEESVDEDLRENNELIGTSNEILCYRTHQVEAHAEVYLSKEQSVDGDPCEDEHLYEDITEYMNVPIRPGTGTQTQQPNMIWKRHLLNNEGIDGKPKIHKEFADRVQQYNDSHVYEELYNLDDTPSERESESSSEEDSDNSPFDKVDNLDSKRTKLSHIAKEIMSSERVFVDVLKLLHINFRDAVLKASCQAGKPVIEERPLNQILFSLPQLYQLNCDLLSELTDRVDHWNENPTIADIFLKKGPYLKMYTSYICEFDKNVAELEEQCRKNPAFAKVVQDFESSPCCANLAVKHYMLKPVQRLPQYQLLLTDYLKNLEEDAPEYKIAQAALNIVKEVANHANERIKQGALSRKLVDVQASLIGNYEIVKPGRVLLKEGILLKLSRKVMQPRMFFLFNDALLYAMPLHSGQYKLNNELPLGGMKVSKPSQEGYQNEFNIESIERSFILSASSPAIRDEWLEAISKAIYENTKKKTSLLPSNKGPEEINIDSMDSAAQLGAKAPIWIPDLRATMCMICTCEFSLTWRRHHCRACGRVVCQACSTNSHPLEYMKNQLARVCDQCFEILQHNSSGNQAPDSAVVSPTAKPNHFRRQKKIPAALKEVSANTDVSSMSGYMERMKAKKKQWKRLWFVIKDKVLYTYAASEDVVALESQPLLGFSLRQVDSESSQQFKLYHKDKLFYIFKTDDSFNYQRWIEAFREALIL